MIPSNLTNKLAVNPHFLFQVFMDTDLSIIFAVSALLSFALIFIYYYYKGRHQVHCLKSHLMGSLLLSLAVVDSLALLQAIRLAPTIYALSSLLYISFVYYNEIIWIFVVGVAFVAGSLQIIHLFMTTFNETQFEDVSLWLNDAAFGSIY